jgi:hypothetical protein
MARADKDDKFENVGTFIEVVSLLRVLLAAFDFIV